jgi:hypothetical protein
MRQQPQSFGTKAHIMDSSIDHVWRGWINGRQMRCVARCVRVVLLFFSGRRFASLPLSLSSHQKVLEDSIDSRTSFTFDGMEVTTADEERTDRGQSRQIQLSSLELCFVAQHFDFFPTCSLYCCNQDKDKDKDKSIAWLDVG